jgi:hypothetical protein
MLIMLLAEVFADALITFTSLASHQSHISTHVRTNIAPHPHRGWLHITSAPAAALPQMRSAKLFEDRVCRLVKR